MQLSWNSFEATDPDARGTQLRFEDLCRQLFVNEYLSENKRYHYLHVNPQNPGLEAEPIFDEVNNRRIGFQAKYFKKKADYQDIYDSFEKTRRYWAGKVDHVYLYCNQLLTSESKGMKPAYDILNSANITLELITGEIIFDIVRRYPYLQTYYFGQHHLSVEWFRNHSERIFSELGERFNREFNVKTKSNTELSFFVHGDEAIELLNQNKRKLLETINSYSFYYKYEAEENLYLQKLKEAVSTIKDITHDTLFQCLRWKGDVMAQISNEKTILENKKNKIQSQADGILQAPIADKIKAKSQIEKRIEDIDTLLRIPENIGVSQREGALLQNKFLVIYGDAGSGKTQLVANQTKRLIDQNRVALLLVGGFYLAQEAIINQIENNLDTNLHLDDILDILESIGEVSGQIVPIMIDALNETWESRLWKTGLPVLIDKIQNRDFLKLVISFRNEYRNEILNEDLKERLQKEEILSIHHQGFSEDSINAVREFLDFYGIPFTPNLYFISSASNPLFLTLYCKTYNGEEVALPKLYDRLLRIISHSVIRRHADIAKKYTEDEDIVTPFVIELARKMMGKRFFTRNDFRQMTYWSEYGLDLPRMIREFCREGLLHNYKNDEEDEVYYFSFDQMNDYFGAKAILAFCKGKEEVKEYLHDNVLFNREGRLIGKNLHLFAHVCAGFVEKYHEECIDIVDGMEDGYQKKEIVSAYLSSFQWRNKLSISREEFLRIIRRYSCNPEEVWTVLISNVIKIDHPLNAFLLHEILFSYELSYRDFIWTIYINNSMAGENARLFDLIQLVEQGNTIRLKEKNQQELLLILFCWLLTSSDRKIRDHTSKAMVEILKHDLSLCQRILKWFENVNDPYLLERLYGIIFAACSKRTVPDQIGFKRLTEYVYTNIFDQESVYPDILLRDYARLIVELFLREYSDDRDGIDQSKIEPPYSSQAIPEIEEKDYLVSDFGPGVSQIVRSMLFEGMGMYGDFGRYVFQAALRSFRIEAKTIFNYAMYFILHELGYNEEYFGDYDYIRNRSNFSRGDCVKCERIGKKYQWIAMHNILARISDHQDFMHIYDDINNHSHYAGPWEPFVRDFDPTLNSYFTSCNKLTLLDDAVHLLEDARKEFNEVDLEDEDSAQSWLSEPGACLDHFRKACLLRDNEQTEWISLVRFLDTGTQNLKEEKLEVWVRGIGYFVTEDQLGYMKECFNTGIDFAAEGLKEVPSTYIVFDREYPWAPSCKEIKDYSWEAMPEKNGDKDQRTTNESLSYEEVLRLIESMANTESYGEGDSGDVKKAGASERESMMLSAAVELRWEGQYDGTTKETISRLVPSYPMIKELQLRHGEVDGFFYDQNGILAAFDMRWTQNIDGLAFRKDLLLDFLSKTGLRLIWVVNAGKEIHPEGEGISNYSDWSGLYTYDGESVRGEITRVVK